MTLAALFIAGIIAVLAGYLWAVSVAFERSDRQREDDAANERVQRVLARCDERRVFHGEAL